MKDVRRRHMASRNRPYGRDRFCTVPGCKRVGREAKGLCHMHRKRLERHGTLKDPTEVVRRRLILKAYKEGVPITRMKRTFKVSEERLKQIIREML